MLLRLMRETWLGERHEICGLLRGRGERVLTAERARNVSPTPWDAFEIDPQALLAAHRRARRRGALEVLGHYHSHPRGDPVPSPRDAAAAAADGSLWLIVTHGAARLWRAVAEGRLHGRFDPVQFDLRIGATVRPDQAGVRMRGPDTAECVVSWPEPPSPPPSS